MKHFKVHVNIHRQRKSKIYNTVTELVVEHSLEVGHGMYFWVCLEGRPAPSEVNATTHQGP